jgi:stage V sporulation protein B
MGVEMSESMEKEQGVSKQSSQFLKGTLILTAGGIVVKVIGSLNWIILSRVLSGEGIGLYQMAFPIYLLALYISQAGIPVAISILTAEKLAYHDYRGANRVFNISLLIMAIAGLCFSVMVYVGAGWMIEHRFIRDPRAYLSLIALSPAILIVPMLAGFRGYLQGWQNMTPVAVSQILEQIFRVGAMVIFAYMFLSKGLEYAAGGASLGAGVGSVAGLLVVVYSYWRVQQKSKRLRESQADNGEKETTGVLIRRIIKLALPVSISSIMLPAVANLDLFIVPLRLEAAGYNVSQATTFYGYLTGMAVPLLNLATVFTASMAISLVPAIAKEHSLENRQGINNRIASAMRISNMVTIPAAFALWMLAEPVCTVIYHAPQAGMAVRVLAIAVYLLGMHQVSTSVLQGMGYTAIPVLNMVTSAIFKVILNWNLTANPALGIQGSAWATVADIGIAAALNMYFVRRYTGYILDVRDLAKNAVAAGVMGIILHFSYHLVFVATASTALAMVVAMVCGGIGYVAVLLMIGGVDEGDVRQIPMVGSFLLRIGHSMGRFKS